MGVKASFMSHWVFIPDREVFAYLSNLLTIYSRSGSFSLSDMCRVFCLRFDIEVCEFLKNCEGPLLGLYKDLTFFELRLTNSVWAQWDMVSQIGLVGGGWGKNIR